MPVAARILDSTWSQNTLYAESIPHLLHWDLAYLWMLEKAHRGEKDVLVPQKWRDRLNGWGYLVALLLDGQLRLVRQPISEPLIRYTAPYNIDHITWLYQDHDKAKHPIGVISPLVLARPLPDYTPEDQSDWPKLDKRSAEIFPREVLHFAALAINDLRRLPTGIDISYPHRLANVLAKAFFGEKSPVVERHPLEGTEHQFPILTNIRWTRTSQDTFSTVNLFLRDRSAQVTNTFVPYCTKCDAPLLRPSDHSPIEAQGEAIQLSCSGPEGHPNTLYLKELLLWRRDNPNENAIAWEGSSDYTTYTGKRPPIPRLERSVAHFEWDPAQVGGDRTNRFLSIDLGKNIVPKRLDDILYKKMLVLGNRESYDGLPLRQEWEDALEHPANWKVVYEPTAQTFLIQDLQIKGWPTPFRLSFGPARYIHRKDLACGLYPSPSVVHTSWRWFRAFLHTDTEQHNVHTSEEVAHIHVRKGQPILPHLTEFHLNVREHAREPLPYVYATSGLDTGCMLRISSPAIPLQPGNAPLHIGFDFGTTNSALYFVSPGTDTFDNPHDNAFLPAACAKQVYWLTSQPSGVADARTIAGFLPGPRYGTTEGGLADPYILPSAFWDVKPFALLYTGQDIESAHYIDRIKFNKRHHSHKEDRYRYLLEYLFLALPYTLARVRHDARIGSLHIGMAFPIGFNYAQRQEYRENMTDLAETLKVRTGFDVEFYSINESAACVLAYGVHPGGKPFLIADMGGGTLDIALISARGTEFETHFIGSYEYAGEAFISAVAEQLKVSTREVSDKVRSGLAFTYASQVRSTLLNFTTVALEVLRILVASFNAARLDNALQEDKASNSVNGAPRTDIILVGNGWHVAEAFNTEGQSHNPKKIFQDYYHTLVDKFGIEGARVFFSKLLERLPSSKHLVAIGALKNAHDEKRKELALDEAERSRIPAGRDLEIELTGLAEAPPLRISWHDLVGEAIRFSQISGVELKQRGRIGIDLSRIPSLQPEWKKILLRSFRATSVEDLPNPEQAAFNEYFFRAADGDVTLHFSQSPFHIILERGWKSWLVEKSHKPE